MEEIPRGKGFLRWMGAVSLRRIRGPESSKRSVLYEHLLASEVTDFGATASEEMTGQARSDVEAVAKPCRP
jgi:hypothetical protein